LNNKLGAIIFWNKLIVAIIESVLIISFCSFIKLKYHLKFDSFGEKVESWMTIVSMAGYLLIPAIAIIQLLRNFDLAEEKGFKNRFGALYEGLDTRKGRQILLEPIVFIARRIFVAWIVIYGT